MQFVVHVIDASVPFSILSSDRIDCNFISFCGDIVLTALSVSSHRIELIATTSRSPYSKRLGALSVSSHRIELIATLFAPGPSDVQVVLQYPLIGSN